MTFQELQEAIISGDEEEASEIADNLLAADENPRDIIHDGIIPAMKQVGEQFDRSEIFIPEMLISADAAQAVLDKIDPLLSKEEREEEEQAVFATVRGDQHTIGKNLACMVFRGAGYRIHDLGADVTPERIVEAIREVDADIVGLSALLTTTMEEQANTIEAIEVAGLRDDVTIVIGGAPITEDYAREIGADIYGETPFDGVQKLQARG